VKLKLVLRKQNKWKNLKTNFKLKKRQNVKVLDVKI